MLHKESNRPNTLCNHEYHLKYRYSMCIKYNFQKYYQSEELNKHNLMNADLY
jgi:hypothetical protein